jgi:hypothetical protein
MSKISVGLIVLKKMPLESSLARRNKRVSEFERRRRFEHAVAKLTDTFLIPDILFIKNKIVFKTVQEKLGLLNNYKSYGGSKLKYL